MMLRLGSAVSWLQCLWQLSQPLPKELQRRAGPAQPMMLGLSTAVSQALFMAGSYSVVVVTRSLQQHVLTWCNFPVKAISWMSLSSVKTNKQHSCRALLQVLQECLKMPAQGRCKLFSHVLQIQFDGTVKCQVRFHICSGSALIMAAWNGFHNTCVLVRFKVSACLSGGSCDCCLPLH